MELIAADVREYIASDEDMTRFGVLSQHAGLEQRLKTPETRRQLLAWLATQEPWQRDQAGFTNKCIEFLHDGFNEAETPVIRPFLLHPDPYVRLRAYEYFVLLHFPDRNKPALLAVLQAMLMDEAEAVRVAGVRYVQRANAQKEFASFLRRWVQVHAAAASQPLESVDLAEQLLTP